MEGSCPVCRVGEVEKLVCEACATEFCETCHGIAKTDLDGAFAQVERCKCVQELEGDWRDVKPTSDKIYVGMQEKNGLSGTVIVKYQGSEDLHSLDPRTDLYFHSRVFAWGYAGSSAAQLALAILANHLPDERQAVRLHQAFKAGVIQHLPESWEMSSELVEEALERLKELDYLGISTT